MAWKIAQGDRFKNKLSKFRKKYPKETDQATENVNKYFNALQGGAKPTNIKRGYIHPESRGIVAIDEKGSGTILSLTRLYIYPDEENETLWLLAIGNKQTQQDDIKLSKKAVSTIKKGKRHG